MRLVRRGIVLLILAAAIVMEAPVWYLAARLSSITGGQGWHRAWLVDATIAHFGEWCLVGTTYTAHWGASQICNEDPNNIDITNQFVAEAVRGGALKLALCIAIIVQCFKAVGRGVQTRGANSLAGGMLCWAMGVTLFAHCVSFWSVAYYDQLTVLLAPGSDLAHALRSSRRCRGVGCSSGPGIRPRRKSPVSLRDGLPVNQRTFILTFHGIGQPVRPFWSGEQTFWVERPFFEAVLDEVEGRQDVLLTFDDANASDFETALPALAARGMKAHFYLVSGLIGQKGFLSAAEVRALHAAGMTIGNHGKLHRSWRGLTERELDEELMEARNCLENIVSDAVRFAACPNGSYDRRVLRHLRAQGYERVYTSDRGWTRANAWLQPRNSAWHSYGLEDLRRDLGSCRLSWETMMRACKRTIKRLR
jgi:peptidoglycan/xylan/chitin deacetylase (PgdA/CDA1 family)